MIGLHVSTAEVLVSVLTSLHLLIFLPQELVHLKALLLIATSTFCFHECHFKQSGCIGRLPSGLTQGSLLLPWLMMCIAGDFPGSWWTDGVCISAVLVGTSFGLCLSMTTVENERRAVIGCRVGYGLTIVVSLVLLYQLSGTASEQHIWLYAVAWVPKTASFMLCATRYFSQCFSFGEMLVCSELLSMLLLRSATMSTAKISITEAFDVAALLINSIAASLLFSIFVPLALREWTLYSSRRIRGLEYRKRRHQFYSTFIHCLAFWSTWYFIQIFSSWSAILVHGFWTMPRILFMVYWCGVLAFGIGSARLIRTRAENIVMRKWFHFIALALFIPALLLDHVFLQLALGGAQVLFLFVEGIRQAALPLISTKIDQFLSPFTDHRDSGPIIYSHFSLLFGLAFPICAANLMESEVETKVNCLALSGLMSLGIGDAFAAIVGTWYGKTHWVEGLDKSIEGTVAFFLTTMLGWLVISVFIRIRFLHCLFPTLSAAVVEATSSQNDNLFLPIYFLMMIKLS